MHLSVFWQFEHFFLFFEDFCLHLHFNFLCLRQFYVESLEPLVFSVFKNVNGLCKGQISLSSKAPPENILPYKALTLLVISSRSLPTVILEGKPCGFIIKSGLQPFSEKGKSS